MKELKKKIMNHLHQMAMNPKEQLKKLFVGTILSAVSMGLIIFTSDRENQWLFYLLVICVIGSVFYAIPGYIGVWVWRMHDVIFKTHKNKDSASK